MNEKQLSEWLKNHSLHFKWAKTYEQKAPHWYLLAGQSPEFFEAACIAINKFGIKEKFFQAYFTYFYSGGFKYWTMAHKGQKPNLRNRNIHIIEAACTYRSLPLWLNLGAEITKEYKICTNVKLSI